MSSTGISYDCVLRDGTALVSTVYLPADVDGPLPCVLNRTPYDPALFPAAMQFLADAGFAAVLQSVRGRYGSGGTWRPYSNEGLDGYDAIEWCAAQEWCDGRVATIGASYSGWTQWAAAIHRPPSLRTMISSVSCMSWTGEWPWRNGVLWPGAIAWLNIVRGEVDHPISDDELAELMRTPMTPLSALQARFRHELPIADEWLQHPTQDAYWSPITLTDDDFARIDIPVLHVTGWFDGCQIGSQLAYEGMVRSSPASDRQALLIGPWDHQVTAVKRHHDGIDFGEASVIDNVSSRLSWLRRWLCDDSTQHPVTGANVFDTGTLQWAELTEFPERSNLSTSLYLDAGVLSWAAPATDGSDSYAYDPLDATPCRTDGSPGAQPSLIRDELHQREDLLVYSSPVLDEDLVLSGAATAVLHVESDAPDTDFFLTLGDQAAGGQTMLVGHGMMRARLHSGLPPRLLQPGEVYELRFDLTARRHTFRSGHRVVVEIASAATPLWAANPNSGGDMFSTDQIRTAHNTVHRGGTTPSRIELPVAVA